MNRDRPLLTALVLLSAALTAQQVALMQVLGWMHWHHFAYMIVAIALLGFGIAGTVLSLAREALLNRWIRLLPWLLLATAAMIPLGVRLIQLDALAVDLPLLFFDPLKNTWRLVALCLLLLPPFFCGGLATGIILTVHARNAGRFYSASLGGAGLGGLIGLMLVSRIEPPHLPAAVATLALVATLCLLPLRTPRGEVRSSGRLSRVSASSGPLENRVQPRSRLVAPSILGVAVLLIAEAVFPADLQPSQFKPIRRTLDLPNATVVASRPSVHGWIQVVAAPALRPAPAVSFNFIGEIPPQRAVFINGLGYGSLLDVSSVHAPRWLELTTDAAAFAATPARHRVALLENGPGGWAALAVARGATEVTVVEPNRALIDVLTASDGWFAPEWTLTAVQLEHASGRSFLRRFAALRHSRSEDGAAALRSRAGFDVIRFPTVGALGGTAGLAATSEQFLLTREAFAEAWHALAPDGVIAVTAWMDFPERNPLRLLATLVETAEAAGVAPRAHLAAVRGWATVTFLLRHEPWTPAAVAALREFCDDGGFDPLLLPDLRPEEREANHGWQNPGFFAIVDRIVDGPREPLYDEHAFALQPASDTRPYFSQFLRWHQLDELTAAFGAQAMPFFELGSLTVALTFLVLAGLGVVGIVLPLARLGWRTPGKSRVLFYFAGLGAGFMLIEIGLILRAHAWLGSPVLGAAFVLTALLVASGGGSLWSERFAVNVQQQRRALILIALGTLAGALVLALLEPLARGWPLAAQVSALLLVVIPLGVAMGMAFPLGLRQLESNSAAHVPWAWAINGCVSVATPAAAVMLAMSAGFGALFAAAALAYGIALIGTGVTK